MCQGVRSEEATMRSSRSRIGLALGGVALGLCAVGAWWALSHSRWGRLRTLIDAYDPAGEYAALTIEYPFQDALFPVDIVPPTVRWTDAAEDARRWLVTLETPDGEEPMHFLAEENRWAIPEDAWRRARATAGRGPIELGVAGADARSRRIISHGHISFEISPEPVAAPIFYREVNLPFIEAVKDPSRIRWRFGAVSSPQPPVILENLPVCGNCHSFSADGSVLGMDVDYANSKGSYVITRTTEDMVLATSDIITWNDYRKEDGEQTFGLLSQVSPDGRYVISTVKDKSVFVPQEDLAFSQLFFPLKGILVVYDRAMEEFYPLPGADDPQYVQSNPTWSPDGQTVVFARSKAYDLRDTRGQGKLLLTREECLEFTRDRQPFRFDLYRVPFNEGRGGTPEPIEGASNNGLSNYFARFSPDGRWIVFCRAESYMLLQPDSQLYIIPAEGGTARRLECNTDLMNSWHSFSPDGRWLVFSSKAFTPYTQLFLAHIDADGHSGPPVLLEHFTAPDRAANIPEFVNLKPTAIRRIQEDFLNDYSFVRAGNEFYRSGEAEAAIRNYYKALELNPNNAKAHHRLGFLLYNVQEQPAEGFEHLRRAVALGPRDGAAQYDLGYALLHQGRVTEAVVHLEEAVRLLPRGWDKQYNPTDMNYTLGLALMQAEQYGKAVAAWRRTLEHSPDHARARYGLATALAAMGQIDEPMAEYRRAVAVDPTVDRSAAFHNLIAANYARQGRYQEASAAARRALRIAQSTGNTQLVYQIMDQITQYQQMAGASGF